jgi:hypothetical protein
VNPGYSRSRVKNIPDLRSALKNFIMFKEKLFVSSPKYNPGGSSRIRIPDPELYFYSSGITETVVES